MPVMSRTFTVPKPPDAVLGYLQDFGHAVQWDPGTVSCDRIDSGPIAVGSQWRNASRFAGRQTELRYELERLEAGRLTFVGRNKTATSTDDMVISPDPAGTRIAYTATIVFHGVAKLVGPFLGPMLRRLANDTEASIVRTLSEL